MIRDSSGVQHSGWPPLLRCPPAGTPFGSIL